MYLYVYVCMDICVYIYTYVYIYIYIYIYIIQKHIAVDCCQTKNLKQRNYEPPFADQFP